MLLKGSPETEIHHEKYTNVLSENVIMRVNVVLAAGPFGYCTSVRDDPLVPTGHGCGKWMLCWLYDEGSWVKPLGFIWLRVLLLGRGMNSHTFSSSSTIE